ncbi:MAG: hypothetical protein MUF18_17920 [Fimbriiglobus sp.]|nr:hypothetical protein [Fimbriiglobus sp.]
MAVHPPTGPFPPNDGSNIFRRGVPKPPGKPVPPAEGVITPSPPPEPAELLDLDDEDALFGTARTQGLDDLDAPLSGVMLNEPPDDDQPVSAILLDDDTAAEDALADERRAAPPSAADSSIFSDRPAPAGGVGSGWLDPSDSAARSGAPTSGNVWSGPLPTDLSQPSSPSTSKYEDAADLFADLRSDTPASDSVWVEDELDAERTGRVTESEVRRVLDTTHPPTYPDDEFNTASSLSDFSLDDADAGGLVGGRGDAIEFEDHLAKPEGGGSSIFDRLQPPDTEIVTDADNIDFNLPIDPAQASGSSMSERGGGLHSDPEAVAADLFAELETPNGMTELTEADLAEPLPADATDDRSPAIAAAVAAGALGGAGITSSAREPAGRDQGKGKHKGRPSAAVPPVPKRAVTVVDADDTNSAPAPVAKRRIGTLFAGLVSGLVLGVGGAAIVYATGLIPNEKKVPVVIAPPTADPQAVAKLEQMKADLDALTTKAANFETVAKERQLAANKAEVELKTLQLALQKAEADAAGAEQAKKDLAAAKKEAADAIAALDPLKKDAADAKKLANDAEAALDLAKKDALEKGKLAADANAKFKAADDTLAGLVKELKANKLLADADDTTKLPEAVKKLAAVAASGDAKKAADALVAAQKERDAAKAALTKAETDAKTATDAMTRAKADADKAIAGAMKTIDDKVKTATEAATTGLKKELADATAAVKKLQDEVALAKLSAKADAEAAAKAKFDEATARATAAEKALDTKVKSLEADFAAKLAEARAGVVRLAPAELESATKAEQSYAAGLKAFRGGRYTDAEGLFATATAEYPSDARYWYYLGLSRTRTGSAEAEAAFRKGAELEGANKPRLAIVDAALESLGFADKERVNKFRR